MRATIAGSGFLLTALLAAAVWAQPGDTAARTTENSSTSPAPTETNRSKPSVEASQLDTFLLRDSKGNLVPVLGMSFEEFERLLKIKRGLAPPAPPDYSLDALTVTGSVQDNLATLAVSATVRVRDTDWVRIPLRMNQAILRGSAEHKGSGEFFITSEAEGDGYLCWLKAVPESESDDEPRAANAHQIMLQFAVPLQTIGDEQRLALKLPRATESSLKLEVPLAEVDARLRSSGEGLLASRSLGGEKSEVSLLGAAGDVQVAWRPARESSSSGEALEAVGEILVKVEGRTRVSSEARLRVRSHAGSVESFRVRIPPGMELSPVAAAGYTAALVSATAAESKNSQVVEVKLDRPASGPIDVRLTATLSSQPRANGSLEPAVWEVLGAVRQRGTVDVAVDGDWLLQWTEDPSVRRVDTPVDSVTLGKLAARFEYFRQPCHLKLQVSPRPTRISVEPTYVIYVDADQTRLEAKLRFRMRGTRAQNIAIESAGWKLDRVAPDVYFAADAAESNSESSWQLPLATDAPAEIEVQLDAHQESPTSDSLLQLALPRPQADLTTPATVVVVPGDNVELIPDSAGTRGLTAEALPPGIHLPMRQQPPLVYRDLGGVERAQLAARFRLRERKTAVSTETLVQLDRRRMQVTQKLLYRIAHEPQRVFELSIPSELQRASGLSVAFGNEVLPLEPITTEPAQPSDSAYRFVAPQDLIGPCEFVLKYALPMPTLPVGESTSLSIPLPAPVDRDESEFSNHSLTVRYSDDLKLDSVAPPSDARSGPAEFEGPHESQLALLHPVSELDIVVSTIQSQESAAVSVHRAWVQTWLSSHGRQDRAAWRIIPHDRIVRLRLPPRSDLASVQAALNGQPIDRTVRERDSIGIPVPTGMQDKEQVLEIWYGVEHNGSDWGFSNQQLEPPVLLNSSAVQRFYWQLCLPSHEHLLTEPEGFAAELGWKWRGLFWARQATVSQPELEAWTGATQQPVLPDSVNSYLFSSFGAAPSLKLVSASQRTVLALFAGIALIVGLALIYVKQLRTPASLLVVVVLLLVTALWAPETTLFVGQAIALGGLIVLVSAFGWWVTTGRLRQVVPVSPSAMLPAKPLESRSTQIPLPRSDRTSPSTTATAPLGIAAVETRP